MTKKHFDAVAELLADSLARSRGDSAEREATFRVGRGLADLFAQWYPGFQPDRFLQAAGMEH